MRKILLFVVFILVAAPAFAAGPVRGPANCAIEWDEPTTNTDGSTLTDLEKYRMYAAPTSGGARTMIKEVGAANTTPAPGSVAWTNCPAMPDGQKWVTMTAVDSAGNESAHSPELPFVYDALKPAILPAPRLRMP